ncbi:MAG: porin [Hydrogenophaga sp.]|uniref:porin n=1 Tax=Hydrogenophaga sp. TaxID=1904254 RepID=UPI001BBCB209|nr:porin [Hydrogenophaga sp.]MDP3537202.1 porin [Azonexus sp.]MBS3911510.1 porin [Hydrogenophaga sp.]MDO9147370.1 porin [Hydrogenophaga sp.]MDO9606558.1 porin [Hydrogenophaga sp.]MDP2165570.1 porin [Hydrogenophaga sp.]
MKKTFIATAATLACAGAWSQVTLYGLADVSITHVSGYAQGSVTSLSSGHMEGSRWGIKGEEDMGGGYKALFTLESRVELDTGGLGNRPTSGNQLPDRLTAGLPPAVAAALTNVAIGPTLGVNLNNTAFDRQAWVGLVTPVGGFLMGRQYTPAFETFATFDSMNTQSALSAAQVASIPAGLDIRYNNTLQYRIVQGPWNAALMYGFGEGNRSANNRLLGINTLYKGGAFNVGVGLNSKKNSAGQQALKTTVLGASTARGDWIVSGMFARIQEPNPSAGPELSAGLTLAGVPAPLISTVLDRLKQDANLIHVGARYNMGSAGHVTVAYNQLNDKRASNADISSYGVAYTYPLSKRTNLNAVLTRFNNSANAQAAPGGNGYLGGVTATAGRDATSLALGIRHSF